MNKSRQTKIAVYIVGALMAIVLFALALTGWPLFVRLPLALLLGGAVSFVMLQLIRK